MPRIFSPLSGTINGIRFDKFVPRITFSGPLVRNRAWFFDGLEAEYDDIYIQELPSGADTNHLLRGSNLIKFQANAVAGQHSVRRPAVQRLSFALRRHLIAGAAAEHHQAQHHRLAAVYARSAKLPQRRVAGRWEWAWCASATATSRMREPPSPFEITPELSEGSYFENLTSRSQRIEGNAALYLPPRHWAGDAQSEGGHRSGPHRLRARPSRAPRSTICARMDTLLRQSVFPATAPFTPS